MNRKTLDAQIDALIAAVMEKANLSKEEALTFVGVTLRRSQDNLLASILAAVPAAVAA